MEYIEECINRQEPVVKVLRLLCLFSLTNNGIKEKTFNFIRREILQAYGYGYLFALEKLQKLGMSEVMHFSQFGFQFFSSSCFDLFGFFFVFLFFFCPLSHSVLTCRHVQGEHDARQQLGVPEPASAPHHRGAERAGPE
jgi:hypothetical protein